MLFYTILAIYFESWYIHTVMQQQITSHLPQEDITLVLFGLENHFSPLAVIFNTEGHSDIE